MILPSLAITKNLHHLLPHILKYEIREVFSLRILVIAPEQLPIPPIKGGSVETNTYNLFSRMARTEKVVIISRTHPSLPQTSITMGGKLKIVRIPFGTKVDYLREAIRRVRGQKFDIIQIENRPVFVPPVRRAFPRTPIVLSLHSLTFMSHLSKERAAFILRRVDRVTSVVPFVTRTMQKWYPRFARKFATAMLGVDTDKFRPWPQASKISLRQRWGVAGTFNVLFIGRIIRRKGLHTLVKAVSILKKRHPAIALVAVGASWPGVKKETEYMRGVRLLSRRLGVPIRFTGYIPPAFIHQMYHLGDVFVCPTQFREGFATVNSEAMASGIPVIASDRGGIHEVVQHGRSGLLIPQYASPQAFARAIEAVMNSPALARKLADGGRKQAEDKLSWENTVRKLKIVYRSLL